MVKPYTIWVKPMSKEAIESLLEALEHAERIATLANTQNFISEYESSLHPALDAMHKWGTAHMLHMQNKKREIWCHSSLCLHIYTCNYLNKREKLLNKGILDHLIS